MSSAKSQDWQLCRLRRETVEALRSLIPGLERGLERGRNHYYEYPGDQGWSVDKLVALLVARENRKRERSRKPRGARKATPGSLAMKLGTEGMSPEELANLTGGG